MSMGSCAGWVLACMSPCNALHSGKRQSRLTPTWYWPGWNTPGPATHTDWSKYCKRPVRVWYLVSANAEWQGSGMFWGWPRCCRGAPHGRRAVTRTTPRLRQAACSRLAFILPTFVRLAVAHHDVDKGFFVHYLLVTLRSGWVNSAGWALVRRDWVQASSTPCKRLSTGLQGCPQARPPSA